MFTSGNLSGDFTAKIYDHVLSLSCSHIVESDEQLIPTGTLLPVAETLFDFRSLQHTRGRKLRESVLSVDGGGAKGIDHCFVIDNADSDNLKLIHAATLTDEVSGRQMILSTTQPGVQIYTANFLPSDESKYSQHNAICLETQHFPDAINRPEFASVVLRAGDCYEQQATFQFRVA